MSSTTDYEQVAYDANASYSIAYVWDNAGRLTSTSAGGKSVSYQYDPAGNRLKSAAKTGYAATLAYDGEGRLRHRPPLPER